jgi:1-acyl-sn-glycerol-3-phosphate acyltransferase
MIRILFALLSALPRGSRRTLVRWLMEALWERYAQLEVSGLEHIPEGPCLFVCNHLSNADGFTLHRVLRPRRVFFLAGVKLQGTVVTRLGAEVVDTISIRPNSPDVEALRRAVAVLRAGHSVLIFPEGGRSRTGALLQAKQGAALVARRAGVPVVPVAVTGTERLLPIDERDMGRERVRRARLTVRVGRSFRVGELEAELAQAEESRQALADAIMRRVAELLPPEYRGFYGGPVPT